MRSTHHFERWKVALAGLLLLWAPIAAAQPVVHLPEAQRTDAFADRWQWAGDTGRREAPPSYWIGYSVDMLMDARSFIGSFSSERSDKATLSRLLYGREIEPIAEAEWDRAASVKVLKEVAFLVRYEGRRVTPVAIEVSNLSLVFDLDGAPLYWIGKTPHDESVALLRTLYEAAAGEETKESAITAIAIHRDRPGVLDFLIEVATDASEPLREKAVFWLGQQTDPRALQTIERIMRGDASMEVREQAVFALSQMDTPAATDLLIATARTEKSNPVRKKAVFWLGQKASQRVAEVLEDILVDEDDAEVQKQALFALQQMPESEGLPVLIRTARTHPSVEVRKHAIFLLGDSDDPRALETLIELAGKVD